MLKIIHCADVHLGSKIEAKLPKHKAEERRGEVRATFHRMVEYAKQNGVRAIVIAGDAFDSDRPTRRDKELFYAVIRENPEVDFLYLRGNHDLEASYEERPANLKTFADEWTAYEYGDVTICGIEMRRENATSLYSTLKLDKAKKNIVVLHGKIANSAGADKINLAKLGGKYIDYLALGHIHSFEENKLDDRGRYAYSGCLEGRGFDECGEKGFVLLEVDEEIKSTFHPFAKRKIEEWEVDITGVWWIAVNIADNSQMIDPETLTLNKPDDYSSASIDADTRTLKYDNTIYSAPLPSGKWPELTPGTWYVNAIGLLDGGDVAQEITLKYREALLW